MKGIFSSILILLMMTACISNEEKQAIKNRNNASTIIDTTLLNVRLKKLDECYKFYDSVEFHNLLNNDVDKALEYAKKFNSIVNYQPVTGGAEMTELSHRNIIMSMDCIRHRTLMTLRL